MTTRLGPLLLLSVALVGLALEGATADVVTMQDGTIHEGKVLRQDEATVVIETTFEGRKELPRAAVATIDTSVPPLREQLKYRAANANDVESRWSLYHWAKDRKFKDELTWILDAIVDLAPEDRRARKLLGHKKVDGRWMTPAEEKEHLLRQFEAQQRAKGLVPYKDEWVTPEERDAREKGLRKDGDDWVTEEEYHRRRGEQFVGGKWIKVGFEEGQELAGRVTREARVNVQYLWGPHFDALTEVGGELTQRILDACEKGFGVMRSALRPSPEDYPESLEERVRLALFKKVPAYVRFSIWFDKTYDVDSLVPGWARAVQRQHGWWWVQDLRATCNYQFPNTDKTFVSNVLHNAALVLFTRYRANFAFPSVWLREGFAYHVEIEALGYTQSFTLGRGGGTGGAALGMKGPLWSDSEQWRGELKKLVAAGRDPPLRRIARMTIDQFRYVELVKSWSVVEFLVRWDPKRFKQFVDLSKEREREEEDALRTAYGVGYRDLDAKWRAYVGADFKVGP